MQITPNRVAAILTGVSGLAAAVAPMVANLDTTSVAAEGAGLLAILIVALKFIDGGQKHEAREHIAALEAKKPLRGIVTAGGLPSISRPMTITPLVPEEMGDVHAMPNVPLDVITTPDEGDS